MSCPRHQGSTAKEPESPRVARGAFPLWYAAMLGGSFLLGYLIARICSEPLNRRTRAASRLVLGNDRRRATQLTAD